MGVSKVLAMSAVALVLVGGMARAGSGSFVGGWHWDKAQSSSIPGEPAPRDIVLDITDMSGGALKWTLTEIDPQGGKHTESFDGKSDGTPTPVTGAGGPTTAAFTLAGATLKAVFKSPDGSSDSWSCALAPDGRKMNCQGMESDGKGHSAGYTDVYDRM
jgi:hypothetical protein